MPAAEDNVEVIKRLYAAFAARDQDALIATIDPECEFRPFGTSMLSGRLEPYRGHDGMRRYFADVAENWHELELEPLDYRAAGTSVIVFGHVRGHGPLAEVDTSVTWVFKLRDGLVIDGRVFPTGGEALRWLDDTARESAS